MTTTICQMNLSKTSDIYTKLGGKRKHHDAWDLFHTFIAISAMNILLFL